MTDETAGAPPAEASETPGEQPRGRGPRGPRRGGPGGGRGPGGPGGGRGRRDDRGGRGGQPEERAEGEGFTEEKDLTLEPGEIPADMLEKPVEAEEAGEE